LLLARLINKKNLRHNGTKPCQVSFLCGDLARVNNQVEKYRRREYDDNCRDKKLTNEIGVSSRVCCLKRRVYE